MILDDALILGGSGFVGRELMEYLACPGTSGSPREGFPTVDATRITDLRARILPLAPKVLINCVGLADVDRAEREPALAAALNGTVVENLVTLQKELPFHLVHISTDYVFDGEGGMYRENDPLNPVNEYGRSKLAGERAAQRSDSVLVIRISSPFGKGFGARKPQFFRYVTDSLRAGKTVKALTDQRVTATFLPDLARAIEILVRQEVRGIVHVTSEDPLSRFEFARQVAEIVGADHELVVGARLTDMTQWTARRPADTTLSVELSRRSGVRYTPVTDALRSLLAS
jgi:dTDP-4-dehydrorhamnose reductase